MRVGTSTWASSRLSIAGDDRLPARATGVQPAGREARARFVEELRSASQPLPCEPYFAIATTAGAGGGGGAAGARAALGGTCTRSNSERAFAPWRKARPPRRK